MTNSKNFERIMAGLEDAVAIAEGTAPAGTYRIRAPAVDVKSIRQRLNLTQAAFAAQFGFALGTVRDWEQGRSEPEPTSRVLLTVIDKEPAAVMRALETA